MECPSSAAPSFSWSVVGGVEVVVLVTGEVEIVDVVVQGVAGTSSEAFIISGSFGISSIFSETSETLDIESSCESDGTDAPPFTRGGGVERVGLGGGGVPEGVSSVLLSPFIVRSVFSFSIFVGGEGAISIASAFSTAFAEI